MLHVSGFEKAGSRMAEGRHIPDTPPIFVAGSNGLAVIAPAIKARLKSMRDDEALSSSTAITA